MNVQRRCFPVMACNNIIDVMGGYKSLHEIVRSVKKYNAKADKWSFVNSMGMAR